jgi:hypothetical protein
MKRCEGMPNTQRTALEQFARGQLVTFARLLSWEPIESLRSFVEVLTPCFVNKMEPELRKDRFEDLEKRAIRWLERSFWEDIRHHPDDPLDKRTLRLKKLFDTAPTIPPRQGDSDHFPISVFIEYDSLRKSLEPVFERRPVKVTNLPKKEAKVFAVGTSEGQRAWGHWRWAILEAINKKRFQRWKRKLLERVRQVSPIEVWPKGQEVWFTEDVIFDLTARTAALRIIEAKMNLRQDAVWKLVTKGKEMLPPKILEKMEKAYAAVESNDSWQFLNQLDPLK